MYPHPSFANSFQTFLITHPFSYRNGRSQLLLSTLQSLDTARSCQPRESARAAPVFGFKYVTVGSNVPSTSQRTHTLETRALQVTPPNLPSHNLRSNVLHHQHHRLYTLPHPTMRRSMAEPNPSHQPIEANPSPHSPPAWQLPSQLRPPLRKRPTAIFTKPTRPLQRPRDSQKENTMLYTTTHAQNT